MTKSKYILCYFKLQATKTRYHYYTRLMGPRWLLGMVPQSSE